jgi:phosphinothricin acetyltransferase
MNLSIRNMTAEDWPPVREIYREGIATGIATFETETPDWEHWNAHHVQHCRLVAVFRDQLLGWAALSQVSSRRVYAGVAEVSVYVSGAARGRGIGKRLLEYLISESERHGFWTLQSGIFPENEASIALHKALGFRQVGIRERPGRLGDEWRDVVLMERRSRIVGG